MNKIKCERCGWHEYPNLLHRHHVVPLSQGGEDTEENINILCANCHQIVHYIKTKIGTKQGDLCLCGHYRGFHNVEGIAGCYRCPCSRFVLNPSHD